VSADSTRPTAEAAPRIEVASYREVFDLERRIYRVDRLRLNPGGIPLRGAIYFVVAILLAAGLGGVPVFGWGLGLLPWYLRYAALPGLLAAIGSTVRVEGRPLHLAIRGLALQRLRPRRLSGFAACAALGTRWRPPPIVVVPDGSDARPRRFRFTGPGTVVIRCRHECVEWRPGRLGRVLGVPDLTLRAHPRLPRPPTGRAITLGVGARLEVEPRLEARPRVESEPPRRGNARAQSSPARA
jgi:hypothetical protein